MSSAMNRYSISHVPLDLSQVERLVMKYCELCGGAFCTSKDEARFPGDYIMLQRGAGKRAPIVCKDCIDKPVSMDYLQDECKAIQSAVGELRAAQARKSAREFAEEKSRYVKHTSPLHHKQERVTRERATGERKRRLAKWREPLMAAFKEKGQLTALEIGATMQYLGDTVGAERSRRASSAIFAARNAGVPIVVVGRARGNHNNIHHNLYGLSTNPVLPELTTPRDSVTHKFMKEVKEPAPAVKLDIHAAYRKLDMELYTQALTTCNWNRTAAAKMLGVSYRQMLLKIEILGLKQHAVVGVMPVPTETQKASIEFTDEFVDSKIKEFRDMQDKGLSH